MIKLTVPWQVTSSGTGGGTGITVVINGIGVAFSSISINRVFAGVRRVGTNRGEVLRGYLRSNIIRGRGGNDRIFGGISVKGFGKDMLYGEDGNDFLSGGGGRDFLSGGNGNDRLLGENGFDILDSDAGTNTMTGGTGGDQFVCSRLTGSTNTIPDFQTNLDVLDLRSIFRQSQFGGSSVSACLTQYVRLQQVGSSTQVRIDADGSGSGTNFVTLTTLQNVTATTLTSTNFVVA